MTSKTVNHSLAILGVNLIIGAVSYRIISKYHLVSTVGLNKFISGFALSTLLQLAVSSNTSQSSKFLKNVAAFFILSAGAGWAGASYKTIILSSLILGSLQFVTSYLFTPDTSRDDSVDVKIRRASFPELDQILTEARDLCSLLVEIPEFEIKSGKYIDHPHHPITLRQLAEINIIVAESRENWDAAFAKVESYKEWPLLQIRLLTQLTLTREQSSLFSRNTMNPANELAEAMQNSSYKCATYVAIALTEKKLILGNHYFDNAKSKAYEIAKRFQAEDYWVKGLDKEELEPQEITYDENLPPISLAEYYFRKKDYVAALSASQKEKQNFFWRIEFLCRLHGKIHSHSSV